MITRIEKTTLNRPERFSGPYWRRLLIFTVVLLTLAVLFLLIYFIRIQLRAFVTPHRNPDIGTPESLHRPYEDIILTSRDGLKISGWYIVGTQPNAIILVHGLDANRAAVLPEAAVLAEAGYHLVLIDLRGHGRSEGAEVTYGYREAWDVEAAVDYLLARPGVEQVGALGGSLGGAVVVRAMAQDPRLKAVVIESSYSNLTEAVEDAFEERSIFPKWPFASLFVALGERRLGLKIGQVDSARDLATIQPRPVFIIHGLDDPMFPPDHARKLYEAAQEPKELWLIEGLGHANPVLEHEAEFKERVLAFFEKAFAE